MRPKRAVRVVGEDIHVLTLPAKTAHIYAEIPMSDKEVADLKEHSGNLL